MLDAFDYKNMWEEFYEKYGKRFLMREYYKNGVCKPYISVKDLMIKFKEDYIKRNKNSLGYLDVEKYYE